MTGVALSERSALRRTERRAAFMRVVARTFKGLTWRVAAFYGLLVGICALGWSIPHDVAMGQGASYTTLHALRKLVLLALWNLPALVTVFAAINWAPRGTRWEMLALGAAVLGGSAAGMLLTRATQGLLDPWLPADAGKMSDAGTLASMAASWLTSSFVAAMATMVYYFAVREDEAHASLHREEMGRLGVEREMTEAQLQVMQAQIEPHFLFNTLANVRRLYQTDPPAGRSMLQHLSRYLSAALPQMRESRSTLGRELALTVAYLNIQKIRMDTRLQFEVDVAESLRAYAVPPMMLLTLVENAIRHGLVPLPQGGTVRVSAHASNGMLRLEVVDTGQGLRQHSGAGVGLANIRARLKTLYGAAARLSLLQNTTSGVTATLELPAAASA
jgi:signal transduction histidine kinase